jgi:hypothetical protein
MTTAELLSGLRTLLDEATEEFWTDIECYAALSHGQREYASIILAQYKERSLINLAEPLPEILRTLYLSLLFPTGVTSNAPISLPTDFWYDLSVTLGAPYSRSLIKREISKNRVFDNSNSYTGIGKGYYYSLNATQIIIDIPTSVTPIACALEYLTKITDIGLNSEPTLPDYTHYAFIIFAFAELLEKTGHLFDESNRQMKLFNSLVKYM